MKALARRLAAIERKQGQHQRYRIAWPSMAAAVAAGVDWPILVIGDTLPRDDWEIAAREQQAALLREVRNESH